MHYFLVLLASLGLSYVSLDNPYAAAGVAALTLLVSLPATLAVLTATADGFAFAGLALILITVLVQPNRPSSFRLFAMSFSAAHSSLGPEAEYAQEEARRERLRSDDHRRRGRNDDPQGLCRI